MFIGHLGAGLALKKFDRRTNLVWLFGAALFSDLLLWVLVLVGVERANVPENYAQLHYLTFQFPYSHGVVASISWSILILVVAQLLTRNLRTAVVLAVGVLSHCLLDWVEHPPEIPLLGAGSPQFGLGLWNAMPMALGLELGLLLFGLHFYFNATTGTGFAARYGLIILLGLLTVMAFGGQLFAPKPSSSTQVAGSSLVSLVVLLLLAGWLDRKRSVVQQ